MYNSVSRLPLVTGSGTADAASKGKRGKTTPQVCRGSDASVARSGESSPLRPKRARAVVQLASSAAVATAPVTYSSMSHPPIQTARLAAICAGTIHASRGVRMSGGVRISGGVRTSGAC